MAVTIYLAEGFEDGAIGSSVFSVINGTDALRDGFSGTYAARVYDDHCIEVAALPQSFVYSVWMQSHNVKAVARMQGGWAEIRAPGDETLSAWIGGEKKYSMMIGNIGGEWHNYAIEVLDDGTVNMRFDGDLFYTDALSFSTSLERVCANNEHGCGGCEKLIDDIIVYSPPYLGGLRLVKVNITGTDTAGMTGVEPQGTTEHDALSAVPYDNERYVYSSDVAGQSHESLYDIHVEDLPAGMTLDKIIGLAVLSLSAEDTATTSTVEIGIDDKNGDRATAESTLLTSWRRKRFFSSVNPATGAEWGSFAEIEGYKFVLRHNHKS